jgi:hypothetical protein
MTTTENPFHLGAHEGTGPAFQDPVEVYAETQPPSVLDEIRSGIKVMMDLSVSIGKQAEQAAATHRSLLSRLEANTPIDYASTAAGTYPSSGALVLSLGSPDQGTYWEVQSVTCGGTDQYVTAAGSAGLYVSSYLPPSSAQSVGLTSMIDQATTLPNTGFYGGRQCLVQDQEYLYLVIWNGTAAQQYQANAQVAVFNNAAAGGKVTNYT